MDGQVGMWAGERESVLLQTGLGGLMGRQLNRKRGVQK